MTNFDWNDLRHFAALARTNRLDEAARLAGCSDATLYRHVRSLEAALGAPLFVRRRDGHRLTELGESLVPLADQAAALMQDVATAALACQRGQVPVRVMTTEFGANWLLLPELANRTPAAAATPLIVEASPEAGDLLRDERTIALRFSRPVTGDHVVRKLGRVSFALYRRGAAADTPSFAPTLPYVGWCGGFEAIAAARWLRALFGEHPPVLRLNTMQGHLEAGRMGIGCVALPTLVGAANSDLVPLAGYGPALEIDAWLVLPRQTRLQASIRQAADLVAAACRSRLNR